MVNVTEISPVVLGTNVTQLTVEFTKTKRNETVSINDYSGFIVDIDGTLYQIGERTNSAKVHVTIVGGDSTTIGYATPAADGFYISNTQKRTIYKILQAISQYNDSALIISSNEALQMLLLSVYNNYNG